VLEIKLTSLSESATLILSVPSSPTQAQVDHSNSSSFISLPEVKSIPSVSNSINHKESISYLDQQIKQQKILQTAFIEKSTQHQHKLQTKDQELLTAMTQLKTACDDSSKTYATELS